MFEISDEKLVSEYLKGDEKSLEILIKKYLKPIYSFIYRYLGNIADAEDLTQEIFFRVWKNLKKFDQQKSFKTWVFSIAKNAAIDFLKKKKAIPFSEFESEAGENFISETISDSSPLPSEIFDRENLAQILAAAMDKLPLKCRLVLFLRYNDHFTFEEIAESFGEPLETIRSRHRRGLITLKKILTE